MSSILIYDNLFGRFENFPPIRGHGFEPSSQRYVNQSSLRASAAWCVVTKGGAISINPDRVKEILPPARPFGAGRGDFFAHSAYTFRVCPCVSIRV